jgi:hypothetical protein
MSCAIFMQSFNPYGFLGPRPYVQIYTPVSNIPYQPSETLDGRLYFVFPTLPGTPRLGVPPSILHMSLPTRQKYRQLM